MTSTRHARVKTFAIIGLAAAVAVGALFLHRSRPSSASVTPVAPAVDPPNQASAGGVTLHAMLQSSRILRGSHETYLAVTLNADAVAKAHARPALNVAVVIDRSGSMAGEKLAHAKQAARQLLAQLGPDDRFSIISYGSDVSVVFASQKATGTAREAAGIAIDRIYDDGGTNLSGGLAAGKAELLGTPEVGAISRVVLISDGMANEGVIGRDELAALAAQTAEHGVSITTIGVGLDFDERTMTSIAVSGRGNYYFVEDAAQLAQIFDSELTKLGATMATNVEVDIAPAPGVEILEALGYPTYRTAHGVRIPVADLHAGEQRKIVLRVRVTTEHAGAIDLASMRAEFLPTGASEKTSAAVALRAEVTDDRAVWRANLDKNAALHIERARAAQAINEATLLYEEGRAGEAEAVLDGYDQAAAEMAAKYDDADLARTLETKVRSTARKAKHVFEAAPAPSSTSGKRGRKGNRAEALDLMVK